MPENFLHYFNQELSFLRKQGVAFAKAYPKIAGRLNIGSHQVEDPFVARLLEGFAFLTARIQQQQSESAETISEHLLNLLYPHYNLPIPASTIVQFTPHPELDHQHLIPRHTALITKNSQGDPCHFRTAYATPLWPLHIANISFNQQFPIKPLRNSKIIKSMLTITIRTNKNNLFIHDLKPDSVRFFIKAEPRHAHLFLELLFTQVDHVILTCGNQLDPVIEIPVKHICHVGFAEEHQLLPRNSHRFSAYQLLTEYVAYPEKFFFFDVKGLSDVLTSDFKNELQLHFFLKQMPALDGFIHKNFLLLGCTPLINLFEMDGELIHTHREQTEYHVTPSFNTATESIEIYQIEDIILSSSTDDNNYQCIPYFGDTFSSSASENKIYWYAKTKNSEELGNYHLPGTETFVIFSELNAASPLENPVMLPKLLCSNRELSNQLIKSDKLLQFIFWKENHELVKQIHVVAPLTSPRYRHSSAAKNMELLSLLSLNQLYNDDNNNMLLTLKNLLSHYHYHQNSKQNSIGDGIIAAYTKRVSVRHPHQLRHGFCHGIELTIELDEHHFADNNAYLFGSVLNYFLLQSSAINSFSYLVLRSIQRGDIFKWTPSFC